MSAIARVPARNPDSCFRNGFTARGYRVRVRSADGQYLGAFGRLRDEFAVAAADPRPRSRFPNSKIGSRVTAINEFAPSITGDQGRCFSATGQVRVGRRGHDVAEDGYCTGNLLGHTVRGPCGKCDLAPLLMLDVEQREQDEVPFEVVDLEPVACSQGMLQVRASSQQAGSRNGGAACSFAQGASRHKVGGVGRRQCSIKVGDEGEISMRYLISL